MPPETDLFRFSRLVEALRPFLGKAIIIGGWAHRLFRLHPTAISPDHAPLLTNDTDIAITHATVPSGAPNLKTRLLENGFVGELSGEDKPPVTHFTLGDPNFYAEFLTPLVGSATHKDGNAKATEAVGGVTAQSVRYLEVLFLQPWIVSLSAENGFELTEPAQVTIANPISYIVQKLLVHSKRKYADRPKDVLYVHDTIELFSSSLPTLASIWTSPVGPSLSQNAIKLLRTTRQHLFTELNDTVRNAAAIAADRPLDANLLLQRCQLGLDEILDSVKS
jgi:hypothetical protein